MSRVTPAWLDSRDGGGNFFFFSSRRRHTRCSRDWSSDVCSRAVSTWTTWIGALEQWGRPQEALRATEESLNRYPDSAALLAFVVPFTARMGQWERAEALLGRLAAEIGRAHV